MKPLKNVKRCFNRANLALFAVAAVLLASSPAFAIINLLPSSASGLAQSDVDALLKIAAIGTDYRPYMPATPLGSMIGLDIGVEVTGVKFPTEFINALNIATGQPPANIPTVVPVPKLDLHKGLPFGVDLGLSYTSYQSLLKMTGVEAQWAFLRDLPGLPDVALRFTYTSGTLWFISTNAYQTDVVISKSLPFINPYVGAGLETWNGTLQIPSSIPQLQSGISASSTGVNPHFFAGLPVKVFILSVAGGIDYNTGGVTSYGGKVSLQF